MELSVAAHDAFEQNAKLDSYNVDISKAFDKVKTVKLIRKMAMLMLSNYILRLICGHSKRYIRNVCCSQWCRTRIDFGRFYVPYVFQ